MSRCSTSNLTTSSRSSWLMRYSRYFATVPSELLSLLLSAESVLESLLSVLVSLLSLDSLELYSLVLES